MEPNCPFCHSSKNSPSFLPNTFFNKKNFSYLHCNDCGLIYLHPLPQADDYAVMYPTSYQNGVNREIIPNNKKLPGLRFAYSRHFELIKKYAPGKKLADYGCGHANFAINAIDKGFNCDGAEYNPAHVKILNENVAGQNFYLIEDFLNDSEKKYDVIRMSNVLEHLEKPGEVVKKLTAKLNPSGILLVEGPLETNFSFAFLIRKMYFRFFGNKTASHPPTHIFFVNAKNQREFFRNNSLEELHFEVAENEWPFPENWKEATGLGGVFKFVCARISKVFCKLNKNWGNTFIYVGKKK